MPIETHNERDMGALGELLMEIKNENIQVECWEVEAGKVLKGYVCHVRGG